jgi:hypothetical protein
VTPTPPATAAPPAHVQQHTNRLIHEKSPYLLQHAHNPVDWYPWGEEAFEKARREKKPIFLSIGYSTCHWCHVMERESFENEEVAAFMNSRFVSIKVDREERPDVDRVYMTFVPGDDRRRWLAAQCLAHANPETVCRRHLFPAGRSLWAAEFSQSASSHRRRLGKESRQGEREQ